MFCLKKSLSATVYLVIVAIFCITSLLLVWSATPPVSFKNIHITSAQTMDLRPEYPVIRKLESKQIEDLEDSLSSLKVSKRDDDLLGLTPLYSLSADSPEIGEFTVACYDLDGNNAAVIYKNRAYRINDKKFIAYLSDICSPGVTHA